MHEFDVIAVGKDKDADALASHAPTTVLWRTS